MVLYIYILIILIVLIVLIMPFLFSQVIMIKKFIISTFFLFGPINAVSYIYFFAHGIAANKRQARLFAKEYPKKDGKLHLNENYIMQSPGVTFDFPDSIDAIEPSWIGSLKKMIAKIVRGNYDQTSFGQNNEIEKLHAKYLKTISDEKQIVYGGISRGASIFFTWHDACKPENVAGAVLESPFGTIADVINLKRKQLGLEFLISEDAGQMIVEFLFRKYNRFGIKPIDCAKKIASNSTLFNTPILIIASISDDLVPWESSFSLYQELKKAGHTKIHFLLIEKVKPTGRPIVRIFRELN